MEEILKTINLDKNYFRKQALNNVNLEIEKGKIVGLLGPNGSGKTTFMKLIAGLLKPTAGEILIDGHEVGVYTKSIVSYLPDVNALYKWMKIKEALEYYKDFFDDFDTVKAKELLKFMKLNEEDKVKSLSKGMLEKLNLTLALGRNAKLYIFDEPLGGIDPLARETTIDAIINSYSENSSIIISTHLVKDVERLFDEVVFINQGEIILKGNSEELREQRQLSIDGIYREVFSNV